MEMIKQQNDKIEWISMAKGFGILGIVAVHTVQRFNISFVASIAASGMYCVQLFFVLSAYLIFKSLDKNTEQWTVKTYFKYLSYKIIRLIPVLYIAVLWHFIMYCVNIGKMPDVYDCIWKNVFFAVTFLNGFSFHYINPWMNWYIGDLVIFIAFAPLLKKLINTPKKAILFFIVCVIVSRGSIFILQKCGVGINRYFYYWLPRQLPVLAVGIFFYLFMKADDLEYSKNSLLTFVFVVVLGFIMSMGNKIQALEIHVRYSILLLAFSYLLFNYAGKYFIWLKALGDNSYGIYLYHGCLLPIAAPLIEKIGFNNNSLNFIICYIVVLLCSFLIAKIVNVVIERPLFSLIKRKI